MTTASDTFPYKLYEMLKSVCDSSKEETGETTPVEWLPLGNGFIILDQQAFLEDVIPHYFNLTKMRSLTRQLNLWNFTRMPSEDKRAEWFHPHFLRDDPSQLRLITRTAVKGSGIKKKFAKSVSGGDAKKIAQMVSPHPLGIESIGFDAGFGDSDCTLPFRAVAQPVTADRFLDLEMEPQAVSTEAIGNPDHNGISDSSNGSYTNTQIMTWNLMGEAKPVQSHSPSDFDYSVVSLDTEEGTAQPYAGPGAYGAFISSPYFMDNAPLISHDHRFSMPCLETYSYAMPNFPITQLETSKSDDWLLKDSYLGIGNDKFILQQEGTKSDYHASNEETGVKNVKEKGTKPNAVSGVVSDIDFDAFLCKYFPPSML